QRRFPRAVLAQQGQDLTPVQRKVDVLVGDNAREAFGNVADFKDRCCCVQYSCTSFVTETPIHFHLPSHTLSLPPRVDARARRCRKPPQWSRGKESWR